MASSSSSPTADDPVTDLTSSSSAALPPRAPGRKSVLLFWASWHDPSSPRGNVDVLFRTLAKSARGGGAGDGGDAADGGGGVDFYRVEAEAVPDLSLKYSVTVVPTFIFLDSSGNVVDRVDGGDDVPRITQAVRALSSRASSAPTSAAAAQRPASAPAPAAPAVSKEEQEEEAKKNLNARLASLINSSQVMLFMKGVPTAPRCGFSRQAVEMLSAADVPFGTFDILTDEDVRQGLKAYSDWPTYPQLYVNGDLVGGLDIMKEMAEEGDLSEQLGVSKGGAAVGAIGGGAAGSAAGADPDLATTPEDRLKRLVNRHKVMLFMKGLPSAPRCGFSRRIVEILDEEAVPYDSFNVLEDEEVRQGLKEYSDWPTYPQLYVDGDLVGGLDIVEEMKEGGDLKDLLKG